MLALFYHLVEPKRLSIFKKIENAQVFFTWISVLNIQAPACTLEEVSIALEKAGDEMSQNFDDTKRMKTKLKK